MSSAHLAHPVRVDAGRGRLAHEPDDASHVDSLVRQVLLTAPGERVNRPDFGCGIRAMLFEPNSAVSATLAQVAVVEALGRWLDGIITADRVEITAEHETVTIHVAYTILSRGERRYLNLEVTA